jgi:membrane-bound serine protease (ClpP class)
MIKRIKQFSLLFCILMLCLRVFSGIAATASDDGSVAIIDMNMAIMPGTQGYLEKSIERAHAEGAKILIVKINTPGGMLGTTQKMVQAMFESPVPIVMYVGPTTGSTATSAGVFLTLAGHVAAMGPGTSMGSAHPVSSDGSDIQGDMRKKAEEMAIALVKSIAERRGRNVKWAEEAVRDSSSVTDQEALSKGVVDLVASDVGDLLKRVKGKKVTLKGGEVLELGDYSMLPRINYQMSVQDSFLNLLANPNIAALLWLGATTGISLEIYNPGALIPGVMGVICLILALLVSQMIPVSYGAVALLVVGGMLIAAELYITSGVLGFAGIVALVVGSLTLIDGSQAPDLRVNIEYILPIAGLLGGCMLLAVRSVVKAANRQVSTGKEGLIGMAGQARGRLSPSGMIFVNGELWSAVLKDGEVADRSSVRVVAVLEGLKLLVEPLIQDDSKDEE